MAPTNKIVAYCVGLTHVGLVCIAPGFYTGYHDELQQLDRTGCLMACCPN
jgi:hypothetical protein